MNKTCKICSSRKHSLVWNDKIRVGEKKFSKKNFKILKCEICNLVSLEKPYLKFENDNQTFRKIFDGENTIEKFLNFHKPRELKKFKKFKKYISFKNKIVLESNCGFGVLLEILKKSSKGTIGIDHKIYKKSLMHRGHLHFNCIDDAIKKGVKVDLMFSLSELEHKVDPNIFLDKVKNIVKKKGQIVFRVPNFENIYKFFIGKNFMKYDFRLSHNYYFSEKNLDLIFKKKKFKIIKKIALNEYSLNHLLTFFKKRRRVKSNEIINFFNAKDSSMFLKNIEKNLLSTSLIYILSND